MLYAAKLNALVFIMFLERLIEAQPRKLYWIVDNYPVHHAQALRQWLSQHSAEIELVFLPSYSPQLHSVDYLNGDVNQAFDSQALSRSFEQLRPRLRSHLPKLPKLPAIVRIYFQHPNIAYAAYGDALSIVTGLILS